MTHTDTPSPRAQALTDHLASRFAGTRFYAHQHADATLKITWFNGPLEAVVCRTLARHLATVTAGAGDVTVQRKLRAGTLSEARRRWLAVRDEPDEYGWHPAIAIDGIAIPRGPRSRQIRRIAEQVILCDPPQAVDPDASPSPWIIAIAALLRDAIDRGIDTEELREEAEAAAIRVCSTRRSTW